MNVLLAVVILLWFARIFANILSYIHLWYLKEYRFDRMFIHLKTNQGKRLMILPFRRPPVTPKTVTIWILMLISVVSFYLYAQLHWAVRLFILDILLFPLSAVFVLLVRLPTLLYHTILISRAVSRVRKHKPMTVIGITGSYGKTSTKEILFTLLSQKYTVLKTEASKNSPIAIAEVVLRGLKRETEVFIVEMGAYKPGEIAEMSRMVEPDIGVVTAINAQHQDLFGSIENTITAKYELIEGLKGKRIGIFNAANSYVREMAVRAKKEGVSVRMYGLSGSLKELFVYAENIRETNTGVSFTVRLGSVSRDMSVSLFGRHQVENVLAAFAAALSVGMTLDELVRASRNISQINNVMEIQRGRAGSTYIDDTFNNNPDAALAALRFLESAKGRKILVFQPMIELGAYAEESHRTVGAAAGGVCDEIFLTNANFSDSFIRGTGKTPVSVRDPGEIAEHLQKILKKDDTVLFKGKEAGRVLAGLRGRI